jgi:hypothetical protein
LTLTVAAPALKGNQRSNEKEIVMKNIITIAILFASTCIGAGSALAQSEQVRVNVPFNFHVGSKSLPAGTYTISSAGETPFIMISNLSRTSVRALALTQPPNRKSTPEHTVVFHKWGDQYFISDVRGGDSSMNLHLPTTKEEKRAKALISEAELRSSDNVLVAAR